MNAVEAALLAAADELTPVYATEGAAANHLRSIAHRYSDMEEVAGCADWHGAWSEMSGYMSEAIDDGRGIDAAEFYEYLRELKHRYVVTPTRRALRADRIEAGG